MKIVTYNIQYGRGRDGQFDLDRIANAVSGADLIALQEVERFWSRSGGVDQPRLLARRFPRHYAAYGPGWIFISLRRFRGRRAPPGGGSSGTCSSRARRCSRYATTCFRSTQASGRR